MKSANLRTCGVLLSSTIIGLAMLVTALDAKAVIILSNLPGSGDYNGGSKWLRSWAWEAVGLQMSSTALTFASLDGYFGNNTGTDLTLGGDIYSDNSGHPGSSLATFTDITVPASSGPTEYSLVTGSSYVLQANTAYWFVMKDVGGVFVTRDTANTAPTRASGYTFNGYQSTDDSGSTWSSDTSGNWTVQIQAVPEPSSVALIFVGVGCLSFCRRSRCKQQ